MYIGCHLDAAAAAVCIIYIYKVYIGCHLDAAAAAVCIIYIYIRCILAVTLMQQQQRVHYIYIYKVYIGCHLDAAAAAVCIYIYIYKVYIGCHLDAAAAAVCIIYIYIGVYWLSPWCSSSSSVYLCNHHSLSTFPTIHHLCAIGPIIRI